MNNGNDGCWIQEVKEPGYMVFIPKRLMALRQKRIIKSAEYDLVVSILQLSKKNGYCYAGNGHLAKENGCSQRALNRSLNKLEKKGLIHREIYTEGGKVRRKIWPTDQLDKSGQVSTGQKGPLNRIPKGIPNQSPGRKAPERDDDNSLLGVHTNSQLSSILQGFFNLWRRTGNTRYSSQSNFQVLAPKWRNRVERLLENGLRRDLKRFQSVAKWYLEHADDDWTPKWNGVNHFCDSFFDIEKSMHRQGIKNGTRDPEEESSGKIKIVVNGKTELVDSIYD